MRRSGALVGLLVVAVVGVLAAAPAWSGDPPQKAVIAHGVTVGGVNVAGMSKSQALAAVRARFARPIAFTFKSRRWYVRPDQLHAYGLAKPAVNEAMTAAPGTHVKMKVLVNRPEIRRYAKYLGRVFDKRAKNARLELRHLRPFITKPKNGLKVRRKQMQLLIRHALLTHVRGPIGLATKTVKPKIGRHGYGAVIVIRRDSKGLFLYRNTRFVRRFGVATGMSQYPTPLGRFKIVTRQRNPWWYPPDSPWAAGAQPIPPGPGNPLGTRWMGLSASGVGIHGTPDSASIGYSASHGCIRMRIPQAEWLFNHVVVGTTVFIVAA
ncbi:MAG TPA: L,D-transpeptidase [Gaiellaceae bacterium]|jgi:hypothetical protein